MPTQLVDSSTGLAAAITFDPANNEVIVGFSGLGRLEEGKLQLGFFLNQALSCAAQWLGLVPKNMRQGSRIVGLMKEHVDAMNRDLPEEGKIKLTVTGFSMGGGVASYAALRNEVPAIVFNPLRLGLGARARVGQNMLANADRYLTEIVIPGDWVSDNAMSHLYKLNPLTWGGVILDSTGRLGNARRLLLPFDPSITGNKRHMAVRKGLERLVHGAEQRDFLLPSISRHWDAALKDKERAGLASEPIGELARAMRSEFPGHAGQIDALIETLGGITMPAELHTRLNECGQMQVASYLIQSEVRGLAGIAKARELLALLPETALCEALGKDLQRLEAALGERIVAIHAKMMQLSGESLEQFAVNRESRESADPGGRLTGTGLPQSELLTLDEALACLETANDALRILNPEVIGGLEDHVQRGAAMMHALQHGFDEGAGHLVTIAARNAKPEAFTRDLEHCQNAEDARELAFGASSQARTLSRLRVDLNRRLTSSPTRSKLDEELGKLQGEWLAKAFASTEKATVLVELLMRELDTCIDEASEQPVDSVLRTKLEHTAQRVHDSMDYLHKSMRLLSATVAELGTT